MDQRGPDTPLQSDVNYRHTAISSNTLIVDRYTLQSEREFVIRGA